MRPGRGLQGARPARGWPGSRRGCIRGGAGCCEVCGAWRWRQARKRRRACWERWACRHVNQPHASHGCWRCTACLTWLSARAVRVTVKSAFLRSHCSHLLVVWRLSFRKPHTGYGWPRRSRIGGYQRLDVKVVGNALRLLWRRSVLRGWLYIRHHCGQWHRRARADRCRGDRRGAAGRRPAVYASLRRADPRPLGGPAAAQCARAEGAYGVAAHVCTFRACTVTVLITV